MKDAKDERERCFECDKPLATVADDAESLRHEPSGGCECLICAGLCWRAWYNDTCQNEAIDWRSRALSAESVVRQAALEALRAAATDVCAWCAIESTHPGAAKRLVREGYEFHQDPNGVGPFRACRASAIHARIAKIEGEQDAAK